MTYRSQPLQYNEYYSLESIGRAPVAISKNHTPAELYIVGAGMIGLNLAYRALQSNLYRGHSERIHVFDKSLERSMGASAFALAQEFPIVDGDDTFQGRQYEQIKNFMKVSRMQFRDFAAGKNPMETGIASTEHIELVEESEWHRVFSDSIMSAFTLRSLKEPIKLRAPNGECKVYTHVQSGQSHLIDPVIHMEYLKKILTREGVQFHEEEITKKRYRELNRKGGVTIQAAGAGGSALSERAQLIPDYGATFRSAAVRLASDDTRESDPRLVLPDEAAIMIGAGAYVLSPKVTGGNIVGGGGYWDHSPSPEELEELRGRVIELGRCAVVALNDDGTEDLLKAPTPEAILQTLADPQSAARPSYAGGIDLTKEPNYRKRVNGASHGGIAIAGGLATWAMRDVEDMQRDRWNAEIQQGNCTGRCQHRFIVVNPETRAIQARYWHSGDTGVV